MLLATYSSEKVTTYTISKEKVLIFFFSLVGWWSISKFMVGRKNMNKQVLVFPFLGVGRQWALQLIFKINALS